MSEEFYYVIRTGCNGASMERMTKKQLLKSLADKDWGDEGTATHVFDQRGCVDLTAHTGLTIVKGTIVTPRPKQVVETYEVD